MEGAYKSFSMEEFILLLEKGTALGWWDKEVHTDAVVHSFSSKEVFLKISQILLESTCVGVSEFNFVEICEIFKNTFFTEHLRWLPLFIR